MWDLLFIPVDSNTRSYVIDQNRNIDTQKGSTTHSLQQGHPSVSLHPSLSLWPRKPSSSSHHGRVCKSANLRHLFRDYKSVWPLSKSSCFLARLGALSRNGRHANYFRRYVDLQPVGMGAFGLVWYISLICDLLNCEVPRKTN